MYSFFRKSRIFFLMPVAALWIFSGAAVALPSSAQDDTDSLPSDDSMPALTPPDELVTSNRLYLGLNGAAVFAHSEPSWQSALNTGFQVGLALGYQYGSYRFEAAFDYTRHPLRNNARSYLNGYDYMLNALYDFDWSNIIRPYIGAGAGFYQFTATRNIGTFNGTPLLRGHLAYQGIMGLNFIIKQHFVLDVHYRLMAWAGDLGGYQSIVGMGLSYFL